MAKEYNISRTTAQCLACGRQLAAGDELMATVREGAEQMERQDYCLACWQAQPRDADPGVMAAWRTEVPRAEEKKRVFVDDDLLVNFFERLEGTDEPAKVNFRFVLALVLMRKKMLVYDKGGKTDAGVEVWNMHFKGSDKVYKVIDPHMDEQKIAQVSENLGQVLEGEL